MYPELFRVPFFHWPIYGYGVMLVVGFLLALELGARLRPTNVFPSHRWVVVAIYAAYALVGVAMAVRLRSRTA